MRHLEGLELVSLTRAVFIEDDHDERLRKLLQYCSGERGGKHYALTSRIVSVLFHALNVSVCALAETKKGDRTGSLAVPLLVEMDPSIFSSIWKTSAFDTQIASAKSKWHHCQIAKGARIAAVRAALIRIAAVRAAGVA